MYAEVDSEKESIFGIGKGKIDRVGLYKRVRLETAHGEIYFPNHVWPVTLDCRYLSINNKFLSKLREDENLKRCLGGSIDINPDVCELGALLHDVGYSEDYEYNSHFHIERGIERAGLIMQHFDVPKELVDPVLSCIWTHDHIDRKELPPLENVLVHDINAWSYFTFNACFLVDYWQNYLKHERPIPRIMKRVERVFKNIILPPIRDMAEPRKNELIGELSVLGAELKRPCSNVS